MIKLKKILIEAIFKSKDKPVLRHIEGSKFETENGLEFQGIVYDHVNHRTSNFGGVGHRSLSQLIFLRIKLSWYNNEQLAQYHNYLEKYNINYEINPSGTQLTIKNPVQLFSIILNPSGFKEIKPIVKYDATLNKFVTPDGMKFGYNTRVNFKQTKTLFAYCKNQRAYDFVTNYLENNKIEYTTTPHNEGTNIIIPNAREQFDIDFNDNI